MKPNTSRTLARFATLAALLACNSAYAQKAGSWSIEAGITNLAPQVNSGDLSPPAFPNTKVDVSSAAGLSGAVTYMLSDNLAINLPLGTGFKHEITGAARGAGFGKLAEVNVLPITLLGQYRFGAANAAWRPYVGAGLTYVEFGKETGSAALTALTNAGGTPTTLSVASKLVPTVQLGAVVNLSQTWFVNAHYAKTFLKAETKFSTGQTLSVDLDPNALSLAIGYRF